MVEREEIRGQFLESVSWDPFECAVLAGLEWIQSSSTIAPKAKVRAVMPPAWPYWRAMSEKAREMSLELRRGLATAEEAYQRFLELERELRERHAAELQESSPLNPEPYGSSYMSYLDNMASLAREFSELRRLPHRLMQECFKLLYAADWSTNSKVLSPEELKALGKVRNHYFLTASPKSAELFVTSAEAMLPGLESELGPTIVEEIAENLNRLVGALLVEEL